MINSSNLHNFSSSKHGKESQETGHEVGDDIRDSFPTKDKYPKNIKNFYEYIRCRYPNRKMPKIYK